MEILNYGEESISVAMEEVEPQDWAKQVYRREIESNIEQLYKKPGYARTISRNNDRGPTRVTASARLGSERACNRGGGNRIPMHLPDDTSMVAPALERYAR